MNIEDIEIGMKVFNEEGVGVVTDIDEYWGIEVEFEDGHVKWFDAEELNKDF